MSYHCRGLLVLTVAVVLGTPVQAQTLTPGQTIYRVGEGITVHFADVPLDHTVGGPRYLELVNLTAPSTAVQTAYLPSDSGGKVVLTGLPVGRYEVRLRYMSATQVVQARTLLTVQGPTTPAASPPPTTSTNAARPAAVARPPISPSRSTALPAHPPMGEYAVYQWNGPGGFVYQYRFSLVNAGRYRVRDDEWGNYSYTASSKRLTFTSGPLRGFGGLYYTTGRNADGPTIALNSSGPVTQLEERANGAYQFAFFRPGGVR
ncbi:hypothetical protein GCM10010840_16620 [Deinococcus aerolatus]|uniref:Carboxypeptidase regulatory-like domain-containing protein n=1 Tax=Deinococcus aerolatus TaxID=522487 RepID=A0ABQ2G7X4_9DEIO|nr:hypothetical protein [Deinococcus aerolatus]GGL79403.1 hypothetical protein GCM10010840_16620 [Deinococcus aerolatus]